jgi:hypothetical protein
LGLRTVVYWLMAEPAVRPMAAAVIMVFMASVLVSFDV